MSKLKRVNLTKANLEAARWLFSPDLKVMVREHELGFGKWDIEVDAYKLASADLWEPDTSISYPVYKTIAEVLADNPIFKSYWWTHGDNVEFF